MGIFRGGLIAAIAIAVTTSVAAAGTTIADFFGSYEGSGFAIDSSGP